MSFLVGLVVAADSSTLASDFPIADAHETVAGGNLQPTADAWLYCFSEAGVGKYQMPKTIYFFDDLAKGLSGKILRLKLPELIAKVTADN
jgi:hypothetical protein